jgi:CheY-like chemotaxis protein
MKDRILLVGDDRILLSTRAAIVSKRWSAECASAKNSLQALRKKPFDLIILCHSLETVDRASLVHAVRQHFPDIPILALERAQETATHLPVDARAVSSEGPLEMCNAIEALLNKKKSRVA